MKTNKVDNKYRMVLNFYRSVYLAEHMQYAAAK